MTPVSLSDIIKRKEFKELIGKDNYNVYSEMNKEKDEEYIKIQDVFGIQTNLLTVDKKLSISLPYIKTDIFTFGHHLNRRYFSKYFYNFEIINELIINETTTEVVDSCCKIKLKKGEYYNPTETFRDDIDNKFVKEYLLLEKSFTDTNLDELLSKHFNRITEMNNLFNYTQEKITDILEKGKKENIDRFEINLEINKGEKTLINIETFICENKENDFKFYIPNIKVIIPE